MLITRKFVTRSCKACESLVVTWSEFVYYCQACFRILYFILSVDMFHVAASINY